MEQYAGGNPEAFIRVYDVVAPRIFAFLLRQTRNRAQAEDLLQQTMLQVHRARDQFIPGAAVVPWAFAIARRFLIDSVRRGPREILHDGTELDIRAATSPRADDLVAASELAARIERTLAQLPEQQRTAFQLIKQEGLTFAEAAEVLGTTVAAVKLRAHRAYTAVRLELGSDVATELEEPDAEGCLRPQGVRS
jgi:RNA polymerase sigma-70 factor (ECF subfamily)